MTLDVFRRLALVAGCSGWAVAIALVWIHLGWAAGVFALVFGPAGAFALSLEPAPPEEGAPPRQTVRERLSTGLSRRDIEARARAARGDDDD